MIVQKPYWKMNKETGKFELFTPTAPVVVRMTKGIENISHKLNRPSKKRKYKSKFSRSTK